MTNLNGWLLDIYPGRQNGGEPADGVVVWLLGEDGQRHRLRQPFPVTFYASGPAQRLRLLWRYLQNQPVPVHLQRTERRELFSERPLTVLAVQVRQPAAQLRLFRLVSRSFPDLTYFDADIPLALHYAAVHSVFPLAHCTLTLGEDGQVRQVQALESPWDLEPSQPSLRTLSLEPDVNPAHALPRQLLLRCGRSNYRLSFQPERPFLVNLRAILNRHDPDLLLTAWGDTWLMPRLLSLSHDLGIDLPLNRDPDYEVEHHAERTYFSYGQVIYRGRQVHLFGRWHVDRCNAMLWDDYELEGVLEIARVTALPLQTAARVSPGTGISAMQMLTALRQRILVPWHKQQSERPKNALELFSSDQGGLVYQPLIGLHRDVGEIDFVSMYPGIMVRFNISPETVGAQSLEAQRPDPRHLRRLDTPQVGPLLAEPDAPQPDGLIPQTLAPLLDKRVQLKTCLMTLPRWDPHYRPYKARSTAHKWLLVTCFGYLGYKNARFGRIEAHEAVTAYGREALLRAKEAAEDLGFKVLQLYVDGMWVQKPGAATVADFQPVLDAVTERTGLPIALDGVYRWVAFLPSRLDERVPVPNRYFGVFQDGSLKVRGLEARRRDTCAFIRETQTQILEMMAQAPDADHLPEYLPRILALLRRRLANLRLRRVPLEALVVGQKLSRALEEYRSPSPAARAATQLLAAGKSTRPGQRVRLLFTLGEPGVYAWDLPEPPHPGSIDVARYTTLLLRAASAALGPLGFSEEDLLQRVVGNAVMEELEVFCKPIKKFQLEISPRVSVSRTDSTHNSKPMMGLL
jgi:DNA polymerase-2